MARGPGNDLRGGGGYLISEVQAANPTLDEEEKISMADDTQDVCENERCDKRHTTGFLLGISSGWEEAADLLLVESGKRFVKDEDEEAELLKEFSKRLRERSKVRRREWETYKEEYGVS